MNVRRDSATKPTQTATPMDGFSFLSYSIPPTTPTDTPSPMVIFTPKISRSPTRTPIASVLSSTGSSRVWNTCRHLRNTYSSSLITLGTKTIRCARETCGIRPLLTKSFSKRSVPAPSRVGGAPLSCLIFESYGVYLFQQVMQFPRDMYDPLFPLLVKHVLGEYGDFSHNYFDALLNNGISKKELARFDREAEAFLEARRILGGEKVDMLLKLVSLRTWF